MKNIPKKAITQSGKDWINSETIKI